MKRSEFIKSASLLSIAICVPLTSCNGISGTEGDAYARPEMCMRILDEGEIAGIGSKYLQNHPNENSDEELKKLILKEMNMNGEEMNEAQLNLNKLIEKDFYNGNIEVINGWVLSRTEARQCAIFFIINR